MKKLMLAAIGFALLSAARAGSYQYYVSGYPAADERHSCTSAVSSVTTATLGRRVSFDALEARFRDWNAAALYHFTSFPSSGFIIIIN